MITLQNDFLRVSIDPIGAELKSVVDLNNPFEYMWQGRAPHWKRTAPVLFPFVGALKNKQYQYKDKSYPMGQHGFARDMAFEIDYQDDEAATFVLRSSAATLALYPFEFELYIAYTLCDRVLAISYLVENPSTCETLYFSIGGHPGFNMNLADGMCELQFEMAEVLNTEVIDMQQGLISRSIRPIGDGLDTLRLSPSVFDGDALIFSGLKSRFVQLVDHGHQRRVAMSLIGVPKLGVWTDKGPFVCLEPWWGIADYVDASGQIEDKDMIKKIAPAGAFQAGYDIAFE